MYFGITSAQCVSNAEVVPKYMLKFSMKTWTPLIYADYFNGLKDRVFEAFKR
jgi:hypothetical protein